MQCEMCDNSIYGFSERDEKSKKNTNLDSTWIYRMFDPILFVFLISRSKPLGEKIWKHLSKEWKNTRSEQKYWQKPKLKKTKTNSM